MNNPFDFFDKIYCINLPDSKLRWSNAITEFQKINIHDRVEKIWVDRPYKDINIPTLKFPRGELGVSLSQTKALVHAIRNNANNVLIFEDDVTFESNTIEVLTNALAELPSDWELFFLGGNPVAPMQNYSNTLFKVSKILCAHAYAVNKSIMLKLYDEMMDKLTWQPYDGVTSMLAEQGHGYITNPPICQTKEGQSEIRNAFRSYTEILKSNWVKYSP
jgi:GR25 family glycosyltransferase involved in LPS biosynthesis